MVGAFVWAVLQLKIFGKFRWAGKPISEAMIGLMKILSKRNPIMIVSWDRTVSKIAIRTSQ